MGAMRIGMAALVVAASLGAAAPALANGCNGVVEFWTWGCAPWDNNNGPNFKYYKKRAVSVPIPRSGGIPIQVKDNQAYATVNGQKMPIQGGIQGLVAAGGGNLVAAGGGNLVAAGGGNIVAQGGGNLTVVQNGN